MDDMPKYGQLLFLYKAKLAMSTECPNMKLRLKKRDKEINRNIFFQKQMIGPTTCIIAVRSPFVKLQCTSNLDSEKEIVLLGF
jgi:hypothetical protein